MTLSPSTRGDSDQPQPVIIWPCSSLGRLVLQRDLPPAVSTQTNLPWLPRAYSKSPSTVGVLRGPMPYFVVEPLFRYGAISAVQASPPLLTSVANTISVSPRMPSR